MEKEKPHTSATVNRHMCNMPNSQKDAEFVMEHLNDPNFDLTQLPSSVVEGESTNRYVGDDGGGAINVDESVVFYLSFLIHILNNILQRVTIS